VLLGQQGIWEVIGLKTK